MAIVLPQGDFSSPKQALPPPHSFDLSNNYCEQFQNIRVDRTFSLRRNQSTDRIPPKAFSWTNTKNSLSPEQIISIFSNPTHQNLGSLNILPRCDKSIISVIANNKIVCESLINCFDHLDQCENVDDTVLIIHSFAFLFPLANETNQEFLINSLASMNTYFPSLLESPQFVSPILMLITTFSKTSTYARDSLICYDIHTLILNLIQSNADSQSEILELSCHALLAIYGNPGEIEESAISESIDSLLELYQIDHILITNAALECLTSIINQKESVADTLIERGAFTRFTELIDKPPFISNLLKFTDILIACCSKPDSAMITQQIIPNIFALLPNESFTSDAFHILSDLLAKMPRIISPLISDEFIQSSLSISSNSTIAIKIEIGYFLATCIQNLSSERIRPFLNEQFFDIIGEMIASGLHKVIIECINGIRSLILLFADDQFVLTIIQFLNESGIIKDLNSLIGDEDCILNDRINTLFQHIECFTKNEE